MAADGILQDVQDKLESPLVRWALVCVCIYVLVKLKLFLFAAALPIMFYLFVHQGGKEDDPPSQAAADPPRDSLAEEEDYDTYAGINDFGDTGSRRTQENDTFDADDVFADMGSVHTQKKIGLNDDALDDFAPLSLGEPKLDMGFMGSGSKAEDKLDIDFGLGPSSNLDSASFLGSLSNADDNLDFLGFGLSDLGGSTSKGKGKGKDKGKDKDKGPRPPDPKQLFVAGIGETPEDEIRSFFSKVGEVDRVKILTHPDGQSKGVCFVTFRTEEQASDALSLSGSQLDGRRLTVRLAGDNSGGKSGGQKGGSMGFGDRGKGDNGPRPPDAKQVFVSGIGEFTTEEEIIDFFEQAGEVDRVKVLTHPDGQSKCRCFVTFRTDEQAQKALSILHGTDFGGRTITVRPAGKDGGKDGGKAGGKGGGGSKGGSRERNDDIRDNDPGPEARTEIDEIIEEALEEEEGLPLVPQDFDPRSRRLLNKLMQRDRVNGTNHAVDALELVFEKCKTKRRDSVQSWNSYVYRLLEGAKDGARREDKNEGPRQSDVKAAWDNLPKEKDSQVKVDRWGQPIVMW